jgi:hypothetical protein
MSGSPEFARPPHVASSRSGVWISGVGLLSEDDTNRLIRWLSSAVVKHRKRKATPAPAVTATDDGVAVDGLGRLDRAAALAMCYRIVDLLGPGPSGQHDT